MPRVCEAMAVPFTPPRILPSGDSAITVEFSRSIDDAANQAGAGARSRSRA